MIPAAKNPLAERLFGLYNQHLLRRAFHRVWMRGEAVPRDRPCDIPTILYGNHCCWWDGLLAFALTRRFDLDAYLMMEEKQLARYRFFRWIGAFSVVRESPREAARSVRYACELLKSPGRVLWIYPQGEIRPQDIRPLGFFPGVTHIAKKIPEVFLIPIGLRYEFLGDAKPEAFIEFGRGERLRTEGLAVRETTYRLEAELTGLLHGLRIRVWERRYDEFNPLLSGGQSIDRWYDAWRSRLLGKRRP